MEKLFENVDTELSDFFVKCFTSSKYCKKVNHVEWNLSSHKEMLRFDHSSITSDEINDRIDGTDFGATGFIWFVKKFLQLKGMIMGDDYKRTPVEVSLLKTHWVFRGTKEKDTSDFDDLLSIFAGNINDSIYDTEFVVNLVDEFWSIHQLSIFLTCCVPFLFHFWACITFMSVYLTKEPEGLTFEEGFSKILVYFLTIYFQLFEFEQWGELGWSYWAEVQNWVDTSSTVLNLVLVVKYDFFYDVWYGIETQ